MTASQNQEIGGTADQILRAFEKSPDPTVRESLLSQLLTEHAQRVVEKITRYRLRDSADDVEEVRADVMLQLVARLSRLQAGESDDNAIADFDSYVAVTTYNACDRHLSRKFPNRRRLKNGLRYLLTHRAGFGVWQVGNEYVAGYGRWQFSVHETVGAKAAELRNDIHAFARDSRQRASWNQQKNAYELLTAIFDWADGPVELNVLTGICAGFWNVTDETIAIDNPGTAGGDERPARQIAAAAPDVLAVTEKRAYLQKLWDEISELPPRQRAAVLLNLRDENGQGVIDLWLVVGVASAGVIAAALEMTTERLAEIWNNLPLDDNRIAEILGLTRQQVINLRKSARERLARKMRTF